MSKIQPINSEMMKNFTLDLIRLLSKRHMFSSINIYVNNLWIASDPINKSDFTSNYIDNIEYFIHKEPVDVKKQIEYCNPKTVTITFEGVMYHEVNYGNSKILTQMDHLAKRYNLYHELGHAWSLSFYEL